jgi:hypothetical protein
MESREKARELVNKMLLSFIDWTFFIPREIQNNRTILSEAKQRALIAVDEILNEYWSHDTKRRDWWQEVKHEIEKL